MNRIVLGVTAMLLAFAASAQNYQCQLESEVQAARAAVKTGSFLATPLVDAPQNATDAAEALLKLKEKIFTCKRQKGITQDDAKKVCSDDDCGDAFTELVDLVTVQRKKLDDARAELKSKLGESRNGTVYEEDQKKITNLGNIIKELDRALDAPEGPEPPEKKEKTPACGVIDTGKAVRAAEAGAFFAKALVDLPTATEEAEALTDLKKQIFECTGRNAGCPPAKKADTSNAAEGCNTNCVNAYTRLVDVINTQRKKLADSRAEMMAKLGDSEDANAFAAAQEKIAAAGVILKKFDLALQAPGSPECDCTTARTISQDWLIRSATQKDSAQIISCVQQMRQALLQADTPDCKDSEGLRDCDRILARLEGILFENGRRDQERLAANTKEYADLKFPGDQTAMNELLAEQKEIKQRLTETKRLLVLPDDKPLLQAFEDYDRYISKLSAGVEYTTLGNAFVKGLPRLGYSARIRYGGRGVPELRPEAGRSHRFGLEHAFSAFLTNSGAQNLVAGTPSTGTTLPAGTNDEEVVPALKIETTIFWPLLRTARLNQRLRSYAGPILLVGAQIADIDEPDPPVTPPTTPPPPEEPRRADSRLYGGFRAALSPEIFADFMIGKNRSLHEWRAEVRGQVPVLRVSDRSRISLGASGNFALGRPPIIKGSTDGARYPDHDSVAIFLSWDADFKLAKAP